MEKYGEGKPITHGINLDWSLIYQHGIPDLWRINVMTDAADHQLYKQMDQYSLC